MLELSAEANITETVIHAKDSISMVYRPMGLWILNLCLYLFELILPLFVSYQSYISLGLLVVCIAEEKEVMEVGRTQ